MSDGEIINKAFDELSAASRLITSQGPGVPRLLVMSGLPMSGKSHLTNLINERMQGRLFIARSDAFRPVVARNMGRAEPEYDRKEHELTFAVGTKLIQAAIEKGWPIIADATNLTEQNRSWAVSPAREAGCPVIVAFLEVSPGIAMDRSRTKDRSGSAATPAVYAFLNLEKESVEMCSTAYVVLDTESDVRPWAEIFTKWLSGESTGIPGMVAPRSAHEPESDSQHYRQAAKEKAGSVKLQGPSH